MSADEAYVALLLVHLHFPDAGSLKAKRKVLASVKSQLHGRMGIAVAEVGQQDLWQRSTRQLSGKRSSRKRSMRSVALSSWPIDPPVSAAASVEPRATVTMKSKAFNLARLRLPDTRRMKINHA